jgi:hypothetical protein
MSARPTDHRRHVSSSTIKVTVGSPPNEVTRFIHKSLLTERSEYFEACFSQPMLESQTEHVQLPEDDPDAFDCFIGWIYTGSILPGLDHTALIKAYTLTDKLMVSDYDIQDKIVERFIAASFPITLKHLLTIADNGLSASPLMTAAIKKFSSSVTRDWVKFRKEGEVWAQLLGLEPSLTMRLLEELRTQWMAKEGEAANRNRSAAAGWDFAPLDRPRTSTASLDSDDWNRHSTW